MRGDVIIIEEQHRRVAKQIVEALLTAVRAMQRCYTITVAGESGSGKSELAQALVGAFGEASIAAGVLQQDDYFVYPPRTNDARRREDIGRVGLAEVRLDLLDEHLLQARQGADTLHKPLVIYAEDLIESEMMSLRDLELLIAEGTYATALQNVDTRIFIARDRLATMAARKRRAREPMEAFIEEVLKIEHAIISAQGALADVIIDRDYQVEFRRRQLPA